MQAGWLSAKYSSSWTMSSTEHFSSEARRRSNPSGWGSFSPSESTLALTACSIKLVQSMGARWFSGLGEKDLFASLFKWMARLGTQAMGRLIWTSRSSSVLTPLSRTTRTMQRPANVRSRSNQVYHRPPPYVSTPSSTKPSFTRWEIGLRRRQGLSVWAPTTENPLPGV